MRQILESKSAMRRRLGSLPFSEKLALLEKLRHRNRVFAYASLLKEYHQLTSNSIPGQEVEDLARHLTPKEVDFLNGLSIDLSTLGGTEVYEPDGKDQWTPQRIRETLKRAWSANDREAILKVLRKGPLLSAAQTAFLRAQSYEALGLPDIALLFMEYAAKKDPETSSYKILTMRLLEQTGRLDEAGRRAEAYLSEEGNDLNLRIFAAHILYDFAKTQRVEALPIYRRLATILEQSLSKYSKIKPNFQSMAVLGYMILANCYAALGKNAEEVQAYESGLEMEPQNSLVLAALGLTYADSDPSRARTYFMKAVERNTIAVSPYLYLAHHALKSADYRGCFELCEKLKNIANQARLKEVEATAWHWGAIAGFELGVNPESVRMAFEMALGLDPFDESIVYNFNLFKQLQQSLQPAAVVSGTRRLDWETNRVFDSKGARDELLENATPNLPV